MLCSIPQLLCEVELVMLCNVCCGNIYDLRYTRLYNTLKELPFV